MFYIQTNKDAAREKIVTVDISKAECEFKDLIPEDPEALLGQTGLIGDHIVLTYSRNVGRQQSVRANGTDILLGER